MTSLSVVIPCYNEEKNLNRGVLDEVNNFLKNQKFSWEVVICNDESTDNSLAILKNFCQTHSHFSVFTFPHGGKPSAVWGGIQKARFPLILFTDMDQSTPIGESLKLLPFIPEYDVVIGSRGISRRGFSLLRKIGSPLFLTFRRSILLPDITDTQCGFKMIKTDIAKNLFPRLAYFTDKSVKTGWRVSSFDVELLFMAQKWCYKIKEIPVSWRNEDTSNTKGGSPAARYQKESLQMIKEIFRIKIRDIRGKYAAPQN